MASLEKQLIAETKMFASMTVSEKINFYDAHRRSMLMEILEFKTPFETAAPYKSLEMLKSLV